MTTLSTPSDQSWCADAYRDSTTDGAHVEVTVRMGDPLTVTDEPCHRGRYFGATIVREMLGAFGVKVCPDCYRYVGLAERTERPMRPKGSGWREDEK